MSAPTLRPYQLGSLEAIETTFFEKRLNRLLIKKPTGTGKTVTFAELPKRLSIDKWIRSKPLTGACMLVIAHREELLEQAADKIQKANPDLMVAIEQGDRYASSFADVVIASIQTLAAMKYRRLFRLLKEHTFRLVVVDEAHHAAADTYRTVLAHLGFLPFRLGIIGDPEAEVLTLDDADKQRKALDAWDTEVAVNERLLVGVTATPNRSDAVGLGSVFQTIAYSYGLKQAIDDGYLVAIKPWVIETAESLDNVRTTAGDFNQKQLAEAVNVERRNRMAFDAWRLHASGRSTIAFTVDVAHAHAVADLWKRNGVAAEAISGETPRDLRRSYLQAFTDGRIEVLANCMVLTEGTDLPRTSCILHLKPTKSATLYEQMTGRGLRLYPGKTDCLVIDLVDVARRHSLQAAPVLYGLPAGLITKGDDLKKTAEQLEELREKFPSQDFDALLAGDRLSMQDLLDRSSTFDIWTVPELGAMGEGLSLRWIRTGDTYRVSYPWEMAGEEGNETLSVQPDMLDHFDVVSTWRPRATGDGVRQRTIAMQVPDARSALALAETYVLNERREVQRLKDKDAHWRSAPASEKQLKTLQRMRVPHNAKRLTKGEASDLLDIAFARRGGR